MDLNQIYEKLMAAYRDQSMELTEGLAEGVFQGLLRILDTPGLLLTGCTILKGDDTIGIYGKGKPDCFCAEGTWTVSIGMQDNRITGTVIFSCMGEYALSDFFVQKSIQQLLSESPYRAFRLHAPVFTAQLQAPGKGMDITGTAVPDFSLKAWDDYRGFFVPLPVPVTGYYFYDNYAAACVNLDFQVQLAAAAAGKLHSRSLSAVIAVRMLADPYEWAQRLVSLLILQLDPGTAGSLSAKGRESSEALAQGTCFQIPIMTDTSYVEMAAYFTPVLSIGNAAALFAQLTGEDVFGMPAADTFLTSFGLKYIGIQVKKDLLHIAQPKQVQIVSLMERPWQTPVPGLLLGQLQVLWTVSWSSRKKRRAVMSAEITAAASVQLGKYTLAGRGRGYLPEMQFEGRLSLYETQTVSLGELASGLQAALPETWTGQNEILSVTVCADCGSRTLYLSAQAGHVMSIHIGSLVLELETVSADIAISPLGTRFGISGGICFGKGDASFVMLLNAVYDNGWRFSGTLGRGEVNIGQLLAQMFGVKEEHISKDIFTVSLNEFSFSYAVSTRQFELHAVMTSRWPQVKGMRPESGGRIRLVKQEQNQTLAASAAVFASIGRFSCLVQADDFYSSSPRYLFRVQFGDVYVQAVYTERAEKERLLTLSLGGTTLGEMVLALIHLVNPNAKPQLEPPWDILDQISLSAFLLEINIDTKTAVFWVSVGKSLAGLIDISKIGLKYENGRVSYLVTGKMLGQEYREDAPLSWDAQNGRPPAPSAQKTKIYYAAAGQHLAVDTGQAGIAEAVSAIAKQLKPGWPSLAYAEENGFLFAADFAAADMFRLKAVFADPKLYGVQAAVCAPQKSPLAVLNGLELELLYRKISDSTGMFSGTLTVPERFSVISLGAVTVHIGRIHAEIYTNGSFLIDLGFPHGEDFSQSFGVDFGIYTGKGGFYFGILKQDAVKNVPATDKGVFSPAVMAGLGVSLGLGRSFDLGFVKGSVSLVLKAFFEGIFAVFRPAAAKAGAEDEVYYHMRAKAGICGTLFLSVDFKILAAEASARIEASCLVELESYQDTVVTLQLALEVSASIKILFIRIRFSFSFERTVTFTIASAKGTAPWSMQALKNVRGTLDSTRKMPEPQKFGLWEIRIRIMPVFSARRPLDEDRQYCAAFLAVLDADSFRSFAELFLAWMFSGLRTAYLERSDLQAYGEQQLKQLTGTVLYTLFAENLHVHAALCAGDVGRILRTFKIKKNVEVTDNGKIII